MKSTQLNIYQRILDELTENILKGVDRKLKTYFDKYKPSKKDEDELLTVDETLKILKCSKQALWNWRKNGILPSYRLGNRVYYKKSDIFSKLIKQE
ncbi:helix-turn-helix domain-containing protein [Algibacter luteus]|uniref:Helix-turn-helix domain-containing protein n=1 Tax=Algibacter luteus TaxID=1178825 RepID=A0A1M6H9P9_9FLAO|nr:helix-turn-helix domain-containing protein [Algibacter luteus]SHJ18937.1 Helix-turn-helix domain-containing protein [Algibacter luteus]